jgi:hypothetical protein
VSNRRKRMALSCERLTALARVSSLRQLGSGAGFHLWRNWPGKRRISWW